MIIKTYIFASSDNVNHECLNNISYSNWLKLDRWKWISFITVIMMRDIALNEKNPYYEQIWEILCLFKDFIHYCVIGLQQVMTTVKTKGMHCSIDIENKPITIISTLNIGFFVLNLSSLNVMCKIDFKIDVFTCSSYCSDTRRYRFRNGNQWHALNFTFINASFQLNR